MLEYYRFKAVHDLFMKGLEEEAHIHLTELQRRYVALCDANLTLKMQVQEYEDILYLARNLIFDGYVYWLVTGSIKQGPFCPGCYNRDGLLMRLAGEETERHCPTCREEHPSIPPAPEKARMLSLPVGKKHNCEAEVVEKKAKIIPFAPLVGTAP